jgi:hypothetical protein
MTDRYQEFLSVLGSVRLAGAEPRPEVIALGERWARGELDADDLAAAAKQAAAGLPLTGRATPDEPERSRPRTSKPLRFEASSGATNTGLKAHARPRAETAVRTISEHQVRRGG